MSLVSFSNISDGTGIDAADVNSPLNTIYDDYNGNIDNSNIASAAAIAGTKLADSAISTAKIADDAVTDTKLDYPRWWQEVGRTTLSVAGDTITVSSIPARKYLMFVISLLPTGGTINGAIRFNNDTATNYARYYSINFGAGATDVSQTSIGVTEAIAASHEIIFEMPNVSSIPKTFSTTTTNYGAATAASSAPSGRTVWGKWSNTSAQITRVDVVNTAGTGDFAIGSEVVVLGHD